jgi:hypothetical protein
MTSAAMPDFDTELESVKRARANIDLLRKRGFAQPKGEMIGKHYVAPHWAEQLAPIIQQGAAAYGDYKTTEKENALKLAMQAEKEKWVGSMPKASQFEVQGPTEPGQGPLMSSPVEPTTQDKLAWAAQGERNPLTKALAAQYGADILIKEPEREEARAFRGEQAGKDRALKLEVQGNQLEFERKRLEENMLRYKDDREMQAKWKKDHDDVLVKIAEINKERALEAAEKRASQVAAATAAKGAKPVPNSIAKPIRAAEEARDGIKTIHDSFDDKYAGAGGFVDKVSGTWNPFSGKDAEASANWWKNYELQAALVERHEKFGTALSEGEKDAWIAATIKPGMKASAIRTNLAERKRIADSFYKKIRQQSIDLGYPQVAKAFHDPDEVPVAEGALPGVTASSQALPAAVQAAQAAPVAPTTPVQAAPVAAMPGVTDPTAADAGISKSPPVSVQLPPAELERANILMSEYRRGPKAPMAPEEAAKLAASDKADIAKELARLGIDAETGGPLQRRAADKVSSGGGKPRKKFNPATGLVE